MKGQLDTFKFKDVDVGDIQSICLMVGGNNDAYIDGAASITRSISKNWLEQNWYIESITITRPNDPQKYPESIRYDKFLFSKCASLF